MVSWGSVVLKVADIDRAGRFWSAALGYEPRPDNPAFLAPPGDRGPRLHLDEQDCTHLDLWAVGELESEVERLVSLGARRVEWEYPEGADFVVLADTEDNLFCVVDCSASMPDRTVEKPQL